LERSRELLASHRRGAECERGGVEEYRGLLRTGAERRQAARSGAAAGAGGAAGFDALKPGDVIARRGNKAVVLQRTKGRGDEPKLLVLTADRGVVRLGPTDFAGPVRAIGSIELPRPFAPRSPAFRRAVAEALRTVRVRAGLLDGLNAPSMAAVCSAFSYETRGPDQGATTRVRFPNRIVRDRLAEIDRIWRDLNVVEDEAGLPETRRPDPGFSPVAHAWAAGKDLEDVLLDEDLTGGDFVRNVKQLIDLLRQVGDVAPAPATASAARSAADALFRGVVAASSTVGSGSAA